MAGWAGADLISNQRAARRVVYHRRGTLTIRLQNLYLPIRTIDISASGIGIFSPQPVPEKQACELHITTLHPSAPTGLILKGTVAYCFLSGTQGFRVGIQYTDLDPATKRLIDDIVNNGI